MYERKLFIEAINFISLVRLNDNSNSFRKKKRKEKENEKIMDGWMDVFLFGW